MGPFQFSVILKSFAKVCFFSNVAKFFGIFLPDDNHFSANSLIATL